MHATALVRDLVSFPLWTALFGRRSRQFGLGMEIPSGPLAFRSRRAPVPLAPLERALLTWAAAGVSGWNGGIPHTTAVSDPRSGCNYPFRFTGRTYASGAAAHSSEIIVSDDDGTFVTRFRDLEPVEHCFDDEASIDAFVRYVATHTVRLGDKRVDLPRRAPHVGPHNAWDFNRPGSTLFFPVVDLAEHAINVLAIYLGMGMTPFDTERGCVAGRLERFAHAGLLDVERRLPLVEFEQHVLASGAMEASQMGHNLMLAFQAMGLGGWMFTGYSAISLMGAHAADGVRGLGFRFQRDTRWPSPNPVGIDGAFEAAVPPYVPTMRDAIARFDARKFGPGGAYDASRAGPFADNARVKKSTPRYAPEMIEMLSAVAEYVFEAYGRFPGTVPTIYLRPCIQAQHIDTEYYDHHHGPGSYLATHADHLARWHGGNRAEVPREDGARAESAAALDRVRAQIERSYAHGSLAYEAFERTADLAAIVEFLRWDAQQPAFTEYLRRWLPAAPACVRVPLEEHITLEEREQHSELFRAMMDVLDARAPAPSPPDARVLEALNYTFSDASVAEDDFGFFVGGFWATEIMSAKRCGQIRRGLRRLGVPDDALEYLRIHDEADAAHGEQVRSDFIEPLLRERPDLLGSVIRGVHDRLARSSAYLAWYEANRLPLDAGSCR